jgi:replicative DNA helicase
MAQPAASVVLNELDAERALLGTFFAAPERFSDLGADINPEWFSDSVARYMFEECMKVAAVGHTLTTSVVISMLPEDCNGVPRTAFYANVRMAGLPASQISGVIATLRDRWARREIISIAEGARIEATQFGAEPFQLSQDMVLSLDTINASRLDRKSTATLATASTALLAALDHPEALRGPTTGLLSLDKRLNGYRAGQLYVLAGRPGMGKSAFMVSSLRRTAEAGYGVAIFSLEMTAEEIAARAMSDMMDALHAPYYGNILKGLIGAQEREQVNAAAMMLNNVPLHIDASPRLTFSEIAARARQKKAALEAEGRFLAVLCIDHMGLVVPSDRYRGNKVAEAGEVSGQARALAKELDCCVLLLCQLSREVEKRDDKRPVMADLRWSGEIEQDAHVVAFLYREAYYLNQDPNADAALLHASKFKLDFLIRKNRNGETADVPLWCSIAHSAVRDE